MPISFGLTSNLSIDQNLSVGGTAAIGSSLTLTSTTASSLLYGNASKVVSSVVLASNLSLTTGTLALATALTSINSVTAESGTALTLTGGSSGASLVLGSGASGRVSAFNSVGIYDVTGQILEVSTGANQSNLVLGRTSTTSGDALGAITFGTSGASNTKRGVILAATLRATATTNASASLDIYTNNAGSIAERARFTETGNLLIGTTTDMPNTAGGLTVAATGSGATATAVNTGGLRSANFGLSTVSGGASYFGGDVNVGNGVSTAAAQLQVGNGRSGSGYALLDLVGDTTYSDYGTRLARGNSGANSTSTLSHRGTGDLEFTANDAAALKFYSNGALVMGITSPGVVNIPNTTSASSSTVGALTVGNGTAATNVAIGGGKVNIGSTEASVGSTSGALQVAGGVGIADKLWIGGAYTSTLSAGINVTGVNIPAITLQSSHASGRNYFIGSNYTANGILSIAGSTTAGGAATNVLANFDSTNGTIAFPQSAASIGVGTGALQVTGGIYAGAASVFAGAVTVNALSGINALAAGTQLATFESSVNGAAVELITKGKNSSGTARQANIGINRFADDVLSFSNGTTESLRLHLTTQAATFAGAVTVGATVSGSKGILRTGSAQDTTFAGNPILAGLWDTTALAAGVGGGLSFGGIYNAANASTEFGYIGAVKENATDGNYSGKVVIGARTNGAGAANMAALTILGSDKSATFAGAVTHTLGTNLPPQTAPASPASGWVLYTDSGDGNKLKAKASTGTVVTLGTP